MAGVNQVVLIFSEFFYERIRRISFS